MKRITKKVLIFFKGVCMGIADVIPGVSGGTVAFLTGIYEELIESIFSFNLAFVKDLARGRVRRAFSKTGWKFLSVLLSGILLAIFSLSRTLKWLLVNWPEPVYAFFFGIILTTVFVIARKIQKMSLLVVAVGVLSALAMFCLAGALPLQTPETWWFLFLSGAIAICAMILPGISGAFILLLLGKYEFIITAVCERNFGVLLIFSAGWCAGLLSFVRILRWLLRRHHDVTLSILAGLVLGSLRKVWPWKEVLSTVLTPDGKVVAAAERNIFPLALTPSVVIAGLLFVCGVYLGFWLAHMDRKGGRSRVFGSSS